MVAEMENTLFTADHADSVEISLTQHDSCPMSRTESDEHDSCPASTDHADTTEITPDKQDSSPASMNDAPSDDDSESTHNNHNSPYYHQIQKYLQTCTELNDVDEEFKDACEKYELRDGILYNVCTGRCVILDLEFMKETLEFAHKDIGHYGR